MIVFPAAAALVSLICAAFTGWDALQRPRPDRVIWTIAFLIFAVAAGTEVAGAALGWSPLLARVYYLAGAVLVVGFLALGELYLLLGSGMPAITPGLALLVVAVAATVVWNAPINEALLAVSGWAAIERRPALVALAASINAGGTAIIVGGALFSAWRLRDSAMMRRRAVGCLFIAAGATVVAMGGTLTRFGHREYLYLAMTAGIAVIFVGVLLTRSRSAPGASSGAVNDPIPSPQLGGRLMALPDRRAIAPTEPPYGEGVRYVAERILSLANDDIAAACRKWGATPLDDEPLSRSQAVRVWRLRLALPAQARSKFDQLSLGVQAELGELYAEIWSHEAAVQRDELHA